MFMCIQYLWAVVPQGLCPLVLGKYVPHAHVAPIRSAFWLKDGRWRQWEAHDCVNIGECCIQSVVVQLIYKVCLSRLSA